MSPTKISSGRDQFQPDYAVPPGWIVKEHLEVYGISQAEFARRCGRSPKLISEIIVGKAPVEAKTALQFEKVLGVDASIWLGLEKNYRLLQEREAEAREAEASAEWARGFPVNELAKRGMIAKVTSVGEKVTALLSFFAVASIDAWETRERAVAVAYRHSPSFESDKAALATWLRMAEIDAEAQETGDYDRAAFMTALKELRHLTREEIPQALEAARQKCNRAGVALVLVKPLPKTRVSGAAWWLSPRKPVIALSGRYRSDDHLWFSFFHEAAHILLHNKRGVFVDGKVDYAGKDEAEANKWVERFLVSPSSWESFASRRTRFTESEVRCFAAEQGIAPGIVVGRLQHQKRLPQSHLNSLKVKLKWADDGSRLYAATEG